MAFDLMDVPVLIGPKRRRLLASGRYDRERLAFRAKRKKKKKHSVNRERSRADAAKAASIHAHAQSVSKAVRAYRAAVRAYWAGEKDEHP